MEVAIQRLFWGPISMLARITTIEIHPLLFVCVLIRNFEYQEYISRSTWVLRKIFGIRY